MAHISKLRGRGSFRRRHGNRKPKPITLVVCEGETEHAYFEAVRLHLKLSRAEVVLATSSKGSAPRNVVAYAEQKCAEPGGYDQIYCVFDRDQHGSFRAARERIAKLASRQNKRLPIAESVSVPCFEFWILLHFEQTDASFANCADVIQRIRDEHVPEYAKADNTFCQSLMSKRKFALTNADLVEASAETNNFDPYTSAHHVVRHLETVARHQHQP